MSEDTAPRRRGRPPMGQNTGADEQTATQEQPQAHKPRRRRASVGGHALKLKAPERKGFTRRWVNDDGNRIAEAEELAYDFVHEQGIETTGPGSRVKRLVGTKANGEPLHAYLMETPNELYAEGVAEKEAETRKIDEAILSGQDSTGQMSQIPGREQYGQGSIRADR